MAVTTVRRTSLDGANVRLLVLAGGRQWCTAIHLDTGALVSAEWPASTPGPPFRQLSVVEGRRSDSDGVPEPMRPEAMSLDAPPDAVATMSRRQAERWMRPLLHPSNEHLLGFAGPAVPYWTLTGERASVAVVAPSPGPTVAGGECRFRWRNMAHSLPLLPTALAGSPSRPRRLVVALTPPRAGHCYKVVAALL